MRVANQQQNPLNIYDPCTKMCGSIGGSKDVTFSFKNFKTGNLSHHNAFQDRAVDYIFNALYGRYLWLITALQTNIL